MSNPPQPSAPNRRWLLFAGIGVGVIALGTLTPMFAPAPQEPEPQALQAEGGPLEFPAEPQAGAMPDVQSVLMRLLAGTGVVLGLCVLALWGCARWLKAPAPPAGEQLRVLEVLRVARTRVYLVQARNQKFLAGVDGSGIKSVVALPRAANLTAPGEGA
jgi:flagellar biogenesis protein FliO